MEYEPQSIPDVVLLKPKVFGDERGFFLETFRQSEFDEHCSAKGRVSKDSVAKDSVAKDRLGQKSGASLTFVQDNHSKSTQGILRGMHFQLDQPQGKLVRVVEGEVFDVAVDLRKSSPTFGQWVGVLLSAENKHLLWVPPGFGHGFYVTTPTAEFVYKCTDYYMPASERSLAWDCPEVGIEWPLVDGQAPSLSDKDAVGQKLSEVDTFA